ncbi:hypothetical protein [Leptolyngbya sp. FACHB-17]|uniref:hypothetical protein n=1 Tax=unclassified Leptolyngbya TaxID=2650499 RepID=UPI001680EE40|nr:hypothetical protein [Leptolyngbya sp. FACHB-17]MBD2079667.1 hypothetical protein [Leptolyngbya sp. FACHB-17]
MEAQPRELVLYVTDEGDCPFETWFSGLRDQLCGGDNSTQDRDILIAKQYWSDFQANAND